jgi:hypothetical protein
MILILGSDCIVILFKFINKLNIFNIFEKMDNVMESTVEAAQRTDKFDSN